MSDEKLVAVRLKDLTDVSYSIGVMAHDLYNGKYKYLKVEALELHRVLERWIQNGAVAKEEHDCPLCKDFNWSRFTEKVANEQCTSAVGSLTGNVSRLYYDDFRMLKNSSQFTLRDDVTNAKVTCNSLRFGALIKEMGRQTIRVSGLIIRDSEGIPVFIREISDVETLGEDGEYESLIHGRCH